MPRVLLSIGIAVIGVSAIGFVFGIVNLALLPSIEEQLLDVMPEAGTAVTQASAQSRDKSYIGIVICVAAFICGIILTRRGIRMMRPVNESTNQS